MIELIPPLVMSSVFLVAAYFKSKKWQIEHVFTRLLVALWYGYVYFAPINDIENQRVFGRFFFFLVGSTEVLSYILRAWFSQKYKKAIGNDQ